MTGLTRDVLIMVEDLSLRGSLYDILTKYGFEVTTVSFFGGLSEELKRTRPGYVIIGTDAGKLEDKDKEFVDKLLGINDNVKIIVLVNQDVPQGEKEDFSQKERIIFLNKDQEKIQFNRSLLMVLKDDFAKKDNETKGISLEGKVLVVDDEQNIVYFVRSYLDKLGFTTDVAFSGEEAIIKAKSFQPDVVILDIIMPGMDGLLVLNRLKEIDSSTTVIVTSGINEDKKTVQEVLDMGAVRYLSKPYSLSKLKNVILENI